jgi:hypothetical protein
MRNVEKYADNVMNVMREIAHMYIMKEDELLICTVKAGNSE